ncbi:MAG: site-2 protease family protein [Planctomycetaceae bacterium]|nr:site-2 protease family protein [Planctomycetaceae bacterium]
MDDQLNSNAKVPPFSDENAADTFFASLEQNTLPPDEHAVVIPASKIRVTSLHALAHYFATEIPGTGRQIDLTAEPPERPLAVILPPAPPKKQGTSSGTMGLNWRMPLLLYVATWLSVTWAGGFVFACCVMSILTCHELGHYIQTRRYRIRSSLPYFIPLPIPGAIFGTMGAIIKMDGRIPDRRVLFDIGISGPLAGLLPTLIFCVIGIQQAEVGPIVGHSLQFGDPLLLQWLSHLVFGPIPDEMTLYLNPIGMAGWFGLFLTTLNLFPLGQLDGGHVFYAILGKRAPALSVLLYTLIVACVIFSQAFIWLFMLFLIFLMNPRHPPTQNDEPPIGVFRTMLGVATLAFIVLGFTINPISETLPDHYGQELLVQWLTESAIRYL